MLGKDQVSLLTQNAVQIFDIVAAAFDSSEDACQLESRQCSRLPSPAGELASEWARIEDSAVHAMRDQDSVDVWENWTSDAFKVRQRFR